jgi:hypothetical protein
MLTKTVRCKFRFLQNGPLVLLVCCGFAAWNCSEKTSPNLPDPFPDLHVASVSPADNTTNVPATTNVVTTFSQQMNLGTIGMKGAYRAMRNGYVTAEWAKHHHELWYNDIKAGKVAESPMVSEDVVAEPVRRAVHLAVK